MIGFLEKVVWVLTIIVILANIALVKWWPWTPPSRPDDCKTEKVENMKLADLEKASGGIFNAGKSRAFYKAGTRQGGETRTGKTQGAQNNDFSAGVTAVEKRGDMEFKTTTKSIREEFVEKFRNFPDLYVEISKSDAIFTKDKDGQPIVLVTKVDRNSLVDRIGLKVGDKVLSVNSSQIKGPEEAKELYEKLKNERVFVVEIDRGGKIEYYYYQIKR